MIVTGVLVATAEVVTAKSAVKLLAAANAVAGTLATAGLLLDRLISAPPNGAPVLNTTVPLEELPPITDDGLRSSEPSVAGAGAGPGVKLRTADQGPGTPSVLKPPHAPEVLRGRQAGRGIDQQRVDVLLLAHEAGP